MEQSGINRIQLIENKDLVTRYREDGSAIQISSAGDVFDVTGEFQMNLGLQEARNRNGKIGYTYDLSYFEQNYSTIQKLRRSVYGYFMVMYLNNLETKLLSLPLLFNEAPQDNNVSATFNVKLTNFVSSEVKFIPFDPDPLPWILDSGQWNDGNYWLDSANWID